MSEKHFRNTTFVVLAALPVIFGGDWSSFAHARTVLVEFDPTSTTTASPTDGNDGLYFPQGSRTSTTTGPPYNPRGSGAFRGGDYTSTSTSYFCDGMSCGSLTSTVAPGSLAWDLASWVLEGAAYVPYYRPGPTTSTSTQPPMAGKYPTKIVKVDKPTWEARNRCKFTVTASQLTNGQRSVLKRGTTEVFTQVDDLSVVIEAVSEDQRPPAPSIWGRLWRGFKSIFTSTKEYYTYHFWLPPHCGRLHYDPAGVTAEVRDGADVKAVMFRTSPEIKAYYEPSTKPAPFPFDISKVGKNRFERLRRCLYGVEITKDFDPGTLEFSSSQRIASVTAKDKSGKPITLASHTILCECRPSRLGHISWWLARSPFGKPIVLLYFGYGSSLGHPVCLRHIMRQGGLGELDSWVNYEALGFWSN
ncbi:hypothetical protein Emag_006780 [Eimeria magna]